MKKNVLVFPCGSEIGLEVHASARYSTHFNLIGASSVDDHGKFVYEKYVGGLPFIDSDNFIEKLNDVIAQYDIDFIVPAHDSAVLSLARAQHEGIIRCAVVTSPYDTAVLARSKRRTYDFFKGMIEVPRMYLENKVDLSDMPLFLKPDVGQGSKGVYKVSTMEELAFYFEKDPSLLALEYLPGKEYTVDCFTNRRGELIFCEGRERQRIQNGISVHSATIEDVRFAEIAETINRSIKFRGVWFFQVKENTMNELVLMEIAPRIAGTMGLVRNKGVNLVLLSLFDLMDYDVEIFENTGSVTIDRALQSRFTTDVKYSHVYIDLDDLIIFNDKVNPTVMAYVYQCINEGVQLHLLTKHTKNLHETLERHRLNGIFDELVQIDAKDSKSDYIHEKDAIFIDDSYAERKLVSDSHSIPVFDAHMLTSLMHHA